MPEKKTYNIPEVTVYGKRKLASEKRRYGHEKARYDSLLDQYNKDSQAYNDSTYLYDNQENFITEQLKEFGRDPAHGQFFSGENNPNPRKYAKAQLDFARKNINKYTFEGPVGEQIYYRDDNTYQITPTNVSGTSRANRWLNSIVDDQTKRGIKPDRVLWEPETPPMALYPKPSGSPPIKPTHPSRPVYDDTYENLTIDTMWPTDVANASDRGEDFASKRVGYLKKFKQDPFTYGDAVKFPQEIKDRIGIPVVEERINKQKGGKIMPNFRGYKNRVDYDSLFPQEEFFGGGGAWLKENIGGLATTLAGGVLTATGLGAGAGIPMMASGAASVLGNTVAGAMPGEEQEDPNFIAQRKQLDPTQNIIPRKGGGNIRRDIPRGGGFAKKENQLTEYHGDLHSDPSGGINLGQDIMVEQGENRTGNTIHSDLPINKDMVYEFGKGYGGNVPISLADARNNRSVADRMRQDDRKFDKYYGDRWNETSRMLAHKPFERMSDILGMRRDQDYNDYGDYGGYQSRQGGGRVKRPIPSKEEYYDNSVRSDYDLYRNKNKSTLLPDFSEHIPEGLSHEQFADYIAEADPGRVKRPRLYSGRIGNRALKSLPYKEYASTPRRALLNVPEERRGGGKIMKPGGDPGWWKTSIAGGNWRDTIGLDMESETPWGDLLGGTAGGLNEDGTYESTKPGVGNQVLGALPLVGSAIGALSARRDEKNLEPNVYPKVPFTPYTPKPVSASEDIRENERLFRSTMGQMRQLNPRAFLNRATQGYTAFGRQGSQIRQKYDNLNTQRADSAGIQNSRNQLYADMRNAEIGRMQEIDNKRDVANLRSTRDMHRSNLFTQAGQVGADRRAALGNEAWNKSVLKVQGDWQDMYNLDNDLGTEDYNPGNAGAAGIMNRIRGLGNPGYQGGIGQTPNILDGAGQGQGISMNNPDILAGANMGMLQDEAFPTPRLGEASNAWPTDIFNKRARPSFGQ